MRSLIAAMVGWLGLHIVAPNVPFFISGALAQMPVQQFLPQSPPPLAPDVRRVFGQPAFNTDVVIYVGQEDIRARLGLGSATAQFALSALLRLAADPDVIDDPHTGFAVSRVFPERLAPYLSPQGREFLATGVLLTASAWAGSNEFERAESRRRFLVNEKDYYRRMVPRFPLTVAFVRPVGGLSEYDPHRQGFPGSYGWPNGGVLRQLSGAPGELTLTRPYPDLALIPMSEENARRLRERSASLLQAERTRQRTSLLSESNNGIHQMLFVERYQIRSVRKSGNQFFADAASIDLRIVDPTSLNASFATIPLPSGTVYASQNTARPDRMGEPSSPSPGFIFDDEMPLLVMAKSNPQLLDNRNFLLAAFMVRRGIERRNAITCTGPNRRPAACIGTSWQQLIPSILARSDAAPTEGDLATFAGRLRERVMVLEQPGTIPDLCALNICRQAPDGKTRINLAGAFGMILPRAEDQQIAAAVVPDAGRLTTFDGHSRGNMGTILSTVTSPLGVRMVFALKLNPAWDEFEVLDASGLGLQFKVLRSGFGARLGSAQTFIIEVEPVALVSGQTPPVVRHSLALDATATEALHRPAAEPHSPWTLLDIRLGMPLAEAYDAIISRAALPGTQVDAITGVINSAGSGVCLQLRREAAQETQRLTEIQRNQARSSGRGEISPAEAEEIAAKAQAAIATRLASENCPDPERDVLLFGRGALIHHSANLKEQIILYRNGSRHGPPVVTAIYRAVFQLGGGDRDMVHRTLAERYGVPLVQVGEPAFNATMYWLESSVRQNLFRPPENAPNSARCHQFWPGESGYMTLPSLLQMPVATDCGAFIRYDKDRVLLVDTRYIMLARHSPAATEPPAPPAQPPRIRF